MEAVMFAKRWLLIAVGLSCMWPAPARAWIEFLSMDVLPQNVGWTLAMDVAYPPVVNGGILTLSAGGFCFYMAPASWINTVNAATGYTIEFRMRVIMQSYRPGQFNEGIWYHDNTNLTMLALDSDSIYISYPPGGAVAHLDATQWHTYRIVVLGSHHQIYVDDVLTIDFGHSGVGGGSMIFGFGDFSSNSASLAEWDYVAYETQAVVPVAQTSWGHLKTLYRAER